MSDLTIETETNAATMAGELRVLMSKLRRKTREARPAGGFTESQLLVLSRLEREGPATVTSLANAIGVRSQSMGSTVASLEEIGFVTREPDPSDKRQTILSLTLASREMIKTYRAARDDWLADAIRTSLSAGERREFARVLELLKHLIER